MNEKKELAYSTNQFNNAIYLAKKEFLAYFYSPIAYVVLCIYLGLSGYFFFDRFFLENQLTTRAFFELQPLILAIMVPAITMRIFSEEWKTGSMELLFTLPISRMSLVIGKFIASFLFLAVNLIFTLLYPISLTFLGNPDWGMIAGGYFGLLLAGAVYISIGMIISAVTSDQIVSLIIGLLVCFLLYGIGRQEILEFIPQTFIARIVEYISVSFHTRNLARGLIDIRDIVYFLSVIVIGIYATKLLITHKN
ncbi:MAG: ABC transporter permease subunit [Spirochaetota bacterium]